MRTPHALRSGSSPSGAAGRALHSTRPVANAGRFSTLPIRSAAGLETPRDIAFVSFDELTPDDFFHPAVTCVLQPTFEIGYRAVEVLLDRIEKGKVEGRPAKIRLPATLVVRESSPPARG